MRARISRRGSERIRRGHPWIYRSDVLAAEADPGALVQVVSERNRPLGWAWFSDASQITLRMVSTAPDPVDEATLIRERISTAAAYRDGLGIDATAWRIVHGESDGLPATIVDRYGDESGVYLVVQTLSQGSDRAAPSLVRALVEAFAPRGILARNDPKVRALEGLGSAVEVWHGEMPEWIHVVDAGLGFDVDLRHGQKTGLFLDQRENHAAAARYARGRALDAFTYNGGFALAMARQADHVLALDSSVPAVEATRRNAAANGLGNVEVRDGNVFDELREFENAGCRFDTIALDPPAFARNRAAVERALRGYKEINLRALRLLRPGGYLITCSCSYNVDDELFLSVVQAAAVDAGASVWLVERRQQARDHPVLVGVPETGYLKCLVLRRTG